MWSVEVVPGDCLVWSSKQTKKKTKVHFHRIVGKPMEEHAHTENSSYWSLVECVCLGAWYELVHICTSPMNKDTKII